MVKKSFYFVKKTKNGHKIEKVFKKVVKLVKKSEERGTAIGIGHVKPKTLNVLKKHIPKLQKDGYKFEFVSKMLY